MTSEAEGRGGRALGRRLILLAALIAATALLYSRGTDAPRVATYTGQSMGASYTVKTVGGPDRDLGPGIQQVLDGVEDAMTTYRDSELSRFNAHRSTEPFPLSAVTLDVLELAKEVATRTGGAFDPTVGPLVEAWGFGGRNAIEAAAAGAHDLAESDGTPSAEELAELRESLGFAALQIDREAGTARKAHPQLEIDLSAVAPGFAVDRVGEWLESAGVDAYMAEAGGEIRVRGRRADGERWEIGIEEPREEGRAVREVLSLGGDGASGGVMSVATSGTYRNFIERDGHRPSHIIDPRTGQPVEHGAAGQLASVTVVHPSCGMADAWATGLTVLGPVEGHALAERAGLAALFLSLDADRMVLERSTTAYQALRRAGAAADDE